MEEIFLQTIGSRESQQDAHFCADGGAFGRVFVVADGLGGMERGAAASKLCVDAFAAGLGKCGCLCEYFENSIEAAGAAVAREIGAGRGGTTVLAAALEGGNLRWASVGDSPLLLFRGGRFFRLNENHCVAREGEGAFARGNVLTSCVDGGEPRFAEIRAKPFALERGDIAAVSSDGILSLKEGFLAELFSSAKSLREIKDGILREYKNVPCADNLTAYLLKI